MKKLKYVLLLVPFLLFQCGNPENGEGTEKEAAIEGEIELISSDPFISLARSWAEDFQNLHPRITINVSSGKPA